MATREKQPDGGGEKVEAPVRLLQADSYDQELKGLHRALVVSAVITSVAFLEATANEFLDGCAESPQFGEFKKLKNEGVALCGHMWSDGLLRGLHRGLIEKLNVILLLLSGHYFKQDSKPVQQVVLLARLRNRLVHANPAKSRNEDGEGHRSVSDGKLERGLGGRVVPSPFATKVQPFFPMRALSSDCAAWAWLSALEYADLFHAALKVRPTYEHMRDHLKVLRVEAGPGESHEWESR